MKFPSIMIITFFILFASEPLTASPLDAVKDATKSWAHAFNSRHTENILAHYSEKAVFWGTVSPTLRDEVTEVRDYFIVIGPDARVSLGNQRPRVFGNIAVNTGYYQFTDEKDGIRTKVDARFSFVYERDEAGKWLIVDHHSSVVPITD